MTVGPECISATLVFIVSPKINVKLYNLKYGLTKLFKYIINE